MWWNELFGEIFINHSPCISLQRNQRKIKLTSLTQEDAWVPDFGSELEMPSRGNSLESELDSK